MIKKNRTYSSAQLTVLVIARVLIGWYCLFEGVSKLMNPNWSSFAFLIDSKGWFAGIFQSMASNSALLNVIDFMNVWGLIAIGLGLILGLLTRVATVSGIVLIGLYWLSHPALINVKYMLAGTDNTMWVDKNLIFIFLLVILLVFPTGKEIGIDRILFNRKK
ncbi:MAG TPA: DoxX family membrane protein [Prolixibacteraceae bacterium]|nr:DoxX family membrane protein [Prolixibacteraceae bacterium]HPR62241.1 DoxX family membrane protein [Prolixibacteraceae bacterium]